MILDQSQINILAKLDQLAEYFNQKNHNFIKYKFLKKLTSSKLFEPKSYYIYGGVGTGKTMLMKEFYNKLITNQKFYSHFNNFMYMIHQSLHILREKKYKNDDEVVEALKMVLINNSNQKQIPKVICFDEFQVNDIADAMLLSKIFTFFFNQKIIVIITSNIYPRDLYPNGLQRDLFLKFIDQNLIPNCEIYKLDNGIDYRKKAYKISLKKFLIDNHENSIIFHDYIKKFTDNKIKNNCYITTWGRKFEIKNSYQDIAILSSVELFFNDLHSADYFEICKNFNLIFIEDLKKFREDDVNEIKRFTLFIDEVYESKLSLIILSKEDIDHILDENLIKKNYQFFYRTISRLKEITSQNYWQNSKFIKNN
jgi:cell division protein ZapE